MSKLTLSISDGAIRLGKDRAAREGRSLSAIVEEQLNGFDPKLAEYKISPGVMALVGSMEGDADEEDYRQHLAEKYDD